MLRVSLSRWHSVNLVPQVSAVSVSANDPPYQVIGRLYEWTWFGVVIRLIVPMKTGLKAWSTGYRGPRWSRRQHRWKWGQEL